MNIAIIGSGNMGTALARALSRAGHRVTIGSRDPDQAKVSKLAGSGGEIFTDTIASAVLASDVILLTVPLKAVTTVISEFPDVRNKIIIETTNAFGSTISGYENATDAIKKLTGCNQVARCFNTMGAENLMDTSFGGLKADTFMAGDSIKAKETARELATDIGFGQCYDLGDDSALQQLEDLSQIWGTLVYKSQLGRRIGFRILT